MLEPGLEASSPSNSKSAGLTRVLPYLFTSFLLLGHPKDRVELFSFPGLTPGLGGAAAPDR